MPTKKKFIERMSETYDDEIAEIENSIYATIINHPIGIDRDNRYDIPLSSLPIGIRTSDKAALKAILSDIKDALNDHISTNDEIMDALHANDDLADEGEGDYQKVKAITAGSGKLHIIF